MDKVRGYIAPLVVTMVAIFIIAGTRCGALDGAVGQIYQVKHDGVYYLGYVQLMGDGCIKVSPDNGDGTLGRPVYACGAAWWPVE